MERVAIDLSASDLEFLERFAAYRNALAKVSEKRLRAQWSRKSMAESFLALHCLQVREQMKEMLAVFGEIPEAKDKDALQKYAARVLAWDKKHLK